MLLTSLESTFNCAKAFKMFNPPFIQQFNILPQHLVHMQARDIGMNVIIVKFSNRKEIDNKSIILICSSE